MSNLDMWQMRNRFGDKNRIIYDMIFKCTKTTIQKDFYMTFMTCICMWPISNFCHTFLLIAFVRILEKWVIIFLIYKCIYCIILYRRIDSEGGESNQPAHI